MNIDRLPQAGFPASTMKVAVDGRWEEALVTPLTRAALSMGEIHEFVGDAEDVAFEVFFDGGTAGITFLGIRLTGIPREQQAATIAACSHQLTQKPHSLLDVVSLLRDLISEDLLDDQPDFLEVGVEGLWRTIGSVVVWRQGQAPPDMDQLRRTLAANPSLDTPQSNPVCVEFAYQHPQPHWLALQISQHTSNRYRLDLQQLHEHVRPRG